MATATIGTGESYTTIQAWVDDLAATLSSSEIGELKDEVFNERVRTTGHATTAANYIEFKATSSTAFDGTEGSSGSKGPEVWDNNGGTWGVFNLEEDYMRVSNITAHQNGNSSSAQNAFRVVNGSTTGDIRIAKCVVHDITGDVVYKSGTIVDTMTVDNVIGWEYDKFYHGVTGQKDTHVFSYCTGVRVLTDADSSRSGIRSAVAKNCIMMHHGDGSHLDFFGLGTGSDKNLSHDTSGSTGLQSKVTTNVFESPTESSEDFTLKTGSPALAAGASISVTDDIIGTARDGSTPDLGVFEDVAAGGANYLISKMGLLGVGI